VADVVEVAAEIRGDPSPRHSPRLRSGQAGQGGVGRGAWGDPSTALPAAALGAGTTRGRIPGLGQKRQSGDWRSRVTGRQGAGIRG
jgi:hypothetical protein